MFISSKVLTLLLCSLVCCIEALNAPQTAIVYSHSHKLLKVPKVITIPSVDNAKHNISKISLLRSVSNAVANALAHNESITSSRHLARGIVTFPLNLHHTNVQSSKKDFKDANTLPTVALSLWVLYGLAAMLKYLENTATASNKLAKRYGLYNPQHLETPYANLRHLDNSYANSRHLESYTNPRHLENYANPVFVKHSNIANRPLADYSNSMQTIQPMSPEYVSPSQSQTSATRTPAKVSNIGSNWWRSLWPISRHSYAILESPLTTSNSPQLCTYTHTIQPMDYRKNHYHVFHYHVPVKSLDSGASVSANGGDHYPVEYEFYPKSWKIGDADTILGLQDAMGRYYQDQDMLLKVSKLRGYHPVRPHHYEPNGRRHPLRPPPTNIQNKYNNQPQVNNVVNRDHQYHHSYSKGNTYGSKSPHRPSSNPPHPNHHYGDDDDEYVSASRPATRPDMDSGGDDKESELDKEFHNEPNRPMQDDGLDHHHDHQDDHHPPLPRYRKRGRRLTFLNHLHNIFTRPRSRVRFRPPLYRQGNGQILYYRHTTPNFHPFPRDLYRMNPLPSPFLGPNQNEDTDRLMKYDNSQRTNWLPDYPNIESEPDVAQLNFTSNNGDQPSRDNEDTPEVGDSD